MMLRSRFPMFSSSVRWALLALGSWALGGCGPGTTVPESDPAAASSARAMVRSQLARSALSSRPSRDASGAPVTPGPTAVVLGHLAPDGTVRVGCVDTEDAAEALVREADDSR